MQRLSIFVVLVLCTTAAFGKTIYVNPSLGGSTAHRDGLTKQTCINDVDVAMRMAHDGDTIVILAGRHEFHFSDKGLHAAPSVTVTGERGPNGEFLTVLMAKRSQNEIVRLTKMRNALFTNLEFLGCGQRGAFVAKDNAGVSMKELYFHKCENEGIKAHCVDIDLKIPGDYVFEEITFADMEINGDMFHILVEGSAMARVEGIYAQNVVSHGDAISLSFKGKSSINVDGIYARDLKATDAAFRFGGSTTRLPHVKNINLQKIQSGVHCVYLRMLEGNVHFDDVVIDGCATTSNAGIWMGYGATYIAGALGNSFVMNRFKFNNIQSNTADIPAITINAEGSVNVKLMSGVFQNTGEIDVRMMSSQDGDRISFENVEFKNAKTGSKGLVHLNLAKPSHKVGFHHSVFHNVPHPAVVASPLCGDVRFSNMLVENHRTSGPFAVVRVSKNPLVERDWIQLEGNSAAVLKYYSSHTHCSKCNSCTVDQWSAREPLFAGCKSKQYCHDGGLCVSTMVNHRCPACPNGFTGDGLDCVPGAPKSQNLFSRLMSKGWF